MNLLKGKIEKSDGGLIFKEAADEGGVTIPLKGPAETIAAKAVGKPIVFGIRPEHLTEESKNGDTAPVSSTIDIAEPMGSESLVYLRAGTGNLIARIHGEALYHMGQPLTVYVNMEKVALFDAETESVIR
jgi:multiple sugar transport system ATP-binding protein